jgi:hypothetical protein
VPRGFVVSGFMTRFFTSHVGSRHPAGGGHGVGVGGGLGPAAIEQVFADLVDGPLTHLPSGRFAADATRPTCAAIAHNLLPTATHLTRRHGCEG